MNSDSPTQAPAPGGGHALLAGGLAAILASTCCLGPLVLVMVGVSGAWIGNLTVLEPFQPYFAGAAVIALVMAWRPIWRPVACQPGQVCAIPQVNRAYKTLYCVVAALVAMALGFPMVAPYFY